MWTKENRARYNRAQWRYPSEVTEEEWGQLGARIPPARRGGGKRTVDIHEVLKGLWSVLMSSGGQWRALPPDLPPRSTIFAYLGRWQADGPVGQSPDTREERCREQAAREPSPRAWRIASQRVNRVDKGGLPLTLRAVTRANGAQGKSARW